MLAAAIGIGSFAHLAYRSAMADAERAWDTITGRARPADQLFTAELAAGLPEIARRYFLHAIAPGTPLRTTVELQMRGAFLLGNKNQHQTYSMSAREILAAPASFVWMPELRSRLVRITGSDALLANSAWTRFWIHCLLPVANAQTSSDLVRSASFRAAMEAIWAPASLLAQKGARWERRRPIRHAFRKR